MRHGLCLCSAKASVAPVCNIVRAEKLAARSLQTKVSQHLAQCHKGLGLCCCSRRHSSKLKVMRLPLLTSHQGPSHRCGADVTTK